MKKFFFVCLALVILLGQVNPVAAATNDGMCGFLWFPPCPPTPTPQHGVTPKPSAPGAIRTTPLPASNSVKRVAVPVPTPEMEKKVLWTYHPIAERQDVEIRGFREKALTSSAVVALPIGGMIALSDTPALGPMDIVAVLYVASVMTVVYIEADKLATGIETAIKDSRQGKTYPLADVPPFEGEVPQAHHPGHDVERLPGNLELAQKVNTNLVLYLQEATGGGPGGPSPLDKVICMALKMVINNSESIVRFSVWSFDCVNGLSGCVRGTIMVWKALSSNGQSPWVTIFQGQNQASAANTPANLQGIKKLADGRTATFEEFQINCKDLPRPPGLGFATH